MSAHIWGQDLHFANLDDVEGITHFAHMHNNLTRLKFGYFNAISQQDTLLQSHLA
jgi:hypothetical protein